jgi:hypothetical protein
VVESLPARKVTTSIKKLRVKSWHQLCSCGSTNLRAWRLADVVELLPALNALPVIYGGMTWHLERQVTVFYTLLWVLVTLTLARHMLVGCMTVKQVLCQRSAA